MSDVQGRRRAAERCKEKDATTRQLLLCAFNALLKDECSSNAAHTLDEIDVVGFGIYKNLRGLDCTIRGLVLHYYITCCSQLLYY